ncbi:uncharacterized protein LOC143612872 [Bidens hawaiensis]|uniref:uncharacterized protein LOC143612872 n=1 Tax=Bidens hawaiensis TaxID=980011 RepID=UPI00404A8B2D
MEIPHTTVDPSNPLYFHPSDHPGMILVSKFFDGNGYGAWKRVMCWKRAMSIALSANNKLGFINNTVPMPTYILPSGKAQNLWNELNSRYGHASGARDELNAVNSIPSCTYGAAHAFAKREEDQRLIQFLVGLNPSHDMIRSNILMMQPLPSIDRANGILIQDEKQREIHTTTTDFTASSASMHANTGGPVSGGTGENRRTLVCTHCKRNGHSVSKCYKLTGFPKDYKFAKGKKFANLVEEQRQSDQKHSDQQGITQQQYHDLMVLLQQNKLQPGTSNTFAANNATTINHDSFRGPFLKSHLVLGDMLNGLYLLEAIKNFADSSFLFNKTCNSVVTVETWHNRLGHLPVYKLKQLSFISNSSFKSIEHCDICSKARQHKFPILISSTSTSKIFELIHIEVWGPYHIATYNGFRYILTIVDDYSRTTWTHLLSTKSNAFSIIQSFIEMVSNQFGTTVKCIRSDNAFELGTGLVQRAYLLSKGIIHQTTCVAVSQQNGIVERKHKHLLETSRALMFQSKLPVQFWGDYILTATHLINRFLTEILNNKTPYEVLTRKLPSYAHMKSFGCLAYASTLSHSNNELFLVFF